MRVIDTAPLSRLPHYGCIADYLDPVRIRSGREPIGRFHDDECTYQIDWFTEPGELVMYAIPDDGAVILMRAQGLPDKLDCLEAALALKRPPETSAGFSRPVGFFLPHWEWLGHGLGAAARGEAQVGVGAAFRGAATGAPIS